MQVKQKSKLPLQVWQFVLHYINNIILNILLFLYLKKIINIILLNSRYLHNSSTNQGMNLYTFLNVNIYMHHKINNLYYKTRYRLNSLNHTFLSFNVKIIMSLIYKNYLLANVIICIESGWTCGLTFTLIKISLSCTG